ncbi:hypothetical protein D3C74_421610 [compost metagenome]
MPVCAMLDTPSREFVSSIDSSPRSTINAYLENKALLGKILMKSSTVICTICRPDLIIASLNISDSSSVIMVTTPI